MVLVIWVVSRGGFGDLRDGFGDFGGFGRWFW